MAPSKDLRHWPIKQAVRGVFQLSTVVVFDSQPLAREIDRKHCYCGQPDRGVLMVECDGCNVWYHVDCVQWDADARGEEDYVCGYCKSAPNEDGCRSWTGDVERPGKSIAWKKPPLRTQAEAEKRGAKDRDEGKEWKGPRNWAEAVAEVKERRVKLRGKEGAKYRKARAKQKEGGHHIIDVAVGGSVMDAPLSAELLDLMEGLDML